MGRMKNLIYILIWNIIYYLACFAMVFLNRTFFSVPTSKNELFLHMIITWVIYIIIGYLLGKLYSTTFCSGMYNELLLFTIIPFFCILYYLSIGTMTNIYFSNIFRFSALALGVELAKQKKSKKRIL